MSIPHPPPDAAAEAKRRTASYALRGRLGAAVAHAKHGGAEQTQKAREGFLAKFEREVDPEGKLSPEERRKRALHARSAFMYRIALRSQKRRAGK